MKAFLLFLIALFVSLNLMAQSELNADRYCVLRNKIYDFNTAKKLKDKEALALVEPFPEVYQPYLKSIRQKRTAWISGIAMFGFAAYVAGSDTIKNDDFNDLNTTQKIVYVGTLVSGAVLLASLFQFEHHRCKSLTNFNSLVKDESTSSIDPRSNDYTTLSMRLNLTGIGLEFRF